MKKYIACLREDGRGRIITVGAKTEQEARAKVIDQLSRPGRYDVLAQWMHFGLLIVEIKGNEK